MNTLYPNKLGHQDALLKVLFEQVTVGIIMTNEGGAIIQCNPYAVEMFGFEIDELLGQQIETLIPNKFWTKDKEQNTPGYKKSDSQNLGVERSLIAKNKNGQQFPVEVSLSYALEGEQNIVIALVKDITKEIEKEKELIMKSEAISSAIIPICFADLEGNITYANPSFIKLWGFEKEEDVIGMSNSKLGTSSDKVQEIMKAIHETGAWTGFDKAKKTDGTSFDVFLTTSLVQNGGDRPIGTIATFMDMSELKQTQKVFEEKSQILSSSMKLAKLGSWQFDLSTNTVFLDDQTKAIFCHTSDDESLSYDAFITLFLPEDQQDIIDNLQHAIRTKSSFKKENSILVNQKDVRFISSEAQALLNEEGEVIKVVGVSLDITERKVTEETNRDISKIVEESLNEIFIFDAETYKFIQVNNGARQNLGYSLEELQEITPVDIKPKYTEETFLKLVQPLLKGEQEKLEFYTIHERKDKTTYPVEVHLQYSKLNNRPVFIAIILDITERRKNELLLMEKEQELLDYSMQLEEKVIERTHELTESQTKSLEAQEVARLGNIEYCLIKNLVQGSKQFYKILELETEDPMTFEEFRSYTHPDDKEYVRSTASDAVKKGTSFEVEHRIITAKGKVKHVYMNSSSTKEDAEGKSIERRGVIQDITTLKTMEIALREKQIELEKALRKEKELGELKSRFVSMASHEFRTPLTTVLSSANLVRMHLERGNLDKYPRHLNNIKSAVNNLTSILNDFLSLEKLESGKVQFNAKPIALNDFVSNILEEINLIAGESQTIIFTHSGDKEANIDEHLVRNVLINLLSNAIKYSEKDIDLHLDKKETSLVIKVKDRGIGIPEEQHEEMFSRFFRASNVSTIQGTGIGLTIVKRYLDIMDGTISFESELGVGTVFTVEIPQ